MSTGISVHIGVNDVDPSHYGGWSSPLKACENDANDMLGLAKGAGFDAKLLCAADATRDAVIDTITAAAETLQAGDIFFLTFAGHGGQVKDMNGDEEDGKDETWVLYDGQLLDDELGVLWAKFEPGVRILVLSDSCHSGSVSKGEGEDDEDDGGLARDMPRAAAIETQKKNYEFYDNIQFNLPDPRPDIDATVRLISGCQDDQKSKERDGNGDFTRALKKLWNDGDYDGNYGSFHNDIVNSMPTKQKPNHLVLGRSSADYDDERPFTV